MSGNLHHKTPWQDRISLQQKSAYAVGMLVNNLQAAALPAMVVILNLALGMDVLWVGLIGAIPRITGAGNRTLRRASRDALFRQHPPEF